MELTSPSGLAASVMLAAREAAEGWEPQNYEDRLVVESSHVLVASDMHVPKHDEKLIEKMLTQAYQEGIDTILLAGDLMDMEEFSSYGIDDTTSSFQRNARIAGAIVRGMARMGFKVYWTLGNHEARLSRTARQQINMEQLALMAGLQDVMASGSLVVSDNPSVYLPVGNWLVTHPSQYGTYPTVVAGKLATRFQANTVVAHEHHWGMTVDETGQFIAISSGGLFDPAKHKYIQYGVTAHRAWQRGYVILHHGRPFLYRGEPANLVSKELQHVG